jgi:4-hydroxy-3-methylbut-2-en-1-yl diphosphate reductase
VTAVTALTRLSEVDGRVLECPAAPMVAGELCRRGVPARLGEPASEPSVDKVFSAAVAAGAGRLFGLGVAVSAAPSTVMLTAGQVLADWLSATGPRTVLLAGPRSFCAGVDRAIDVVRRVLRDRGRPVYVRKQIVHNVHVVEELAGLGAVFVDDLDEVPAGQTVVFSAHGVSPAVREQAAARALSVVDATCPLVAKVHAEARRFAARGDTVVLVGHPGHEEIEGTRGEAPESIVLVEDVEDIARLRVDDESRVSYLTQTTLAADETAGVVDALRARFPGLRGPSTEDICYASTNRQEALLAVVEDADLVLVVGSSNSSNSVRLVELSQRHGTPARLIDDASDIRPAWLAGARTVGLTAGASAPDTLVDDVITALGGLGAVDVVERTTTQETVRFGPPSTVGAS